MSKNVPGLDVSRPILDALSQPVIVTDLNNVVVYWNAAAAKFYGHSAEEAVGGPAAAVLGVPMDHDLMVVVDAELAAGRPWSGELGAQPAGGPLKTAHVTLTPLFGAGGRQVAVLGTAVDVTAAVDDRRRLTEALAMVEQTSDALRHQALHDALTGLPNRTLVLDRAEQMLIRASRQRSAAAALFLDIDHFKDINDTHGHAAGDELLKAVATRLSLALRDADTVGRLGGDEFVILAEGDSLDGGAELVAERLLAVVREPFELHGAHGEPTRCAVTVSIGVAEWHEQDLAGLLHEADLALYRAKGSGRDRYALFAAEMHSVVHDRQALEVDLRRALDLGQFFLDYQPTFNLYDSSTIGVEALLRWRHPERGAIAALDFIDTLERTGLIVPVGRWAVAEACRQGARWYRDGLPLTVSVNVSAKQLQSDFFVNDLVIALRDSGFPPASLVVEISESILMRDVTAIVEQLTALKRLGVRIAIDDFGTSYSSLAHLSKFPVDILKIDKSFISALGRSQDGESLVHALLQLGNQLGVQTVAEGIETEDQLHRLQRQDCDTGQGFLVAKPMSADELVGFVRGAMRPADEENPITAVVGMPHA